MAAVTGATFLGRTDIASLFVRRLSVVSVRVTSSGLGAITFNNVYIDIVVVYVLRHRGSVPLRNGVRIRHCFNTCNSVYIGVVSVRFETL